MPAATKPSLGEQRAVLVAIEELEAERAKGYARAMELRAEMAQLWEGTRQGFAEMELAGTGLVGQIRAARELEDGARLVELFPKLHELLTAGVVFVPTAEAVLVATRRCTPEVQARVDVALAGTLVGTNVVDVRRLVAATILKVEAELDPKLTEERLDAARKDARVWTSNGTDGMTSIGAVLDAVAGRRWAVDFEQLVRGQRVLDARNGVERTLEAVKAEVFANLPTLVLELVRAARDGRLTELAELDPTTAAELEQLARDTLELPLPAEEPADEAVSPTTGEVRVETDPFDETTVVDPYRDAVWDLPPEPTEPEIPEAPPPSAGAAQDAAFWRDAHPLSTDINSTDPKDLLAQVLLLRCLQMPLQAPVTLNLHIPMVTALDLSHAPGVLEGYGPLDAWRLRELLPSAHIREIYVDADSGVPLGSQATPERPRQGQDDPVELARRIRHLTLVDWAEPQHDPSAALARQVKTRDQRCSGPGCTMAACRCHLDHEDEFPDGPTAEWNLGDKSPRCHGAKHHGWSADRRPDGSTLWTSPTGRTYTSRSVWDPPPKPKLNVSFHTAPDDHTVEIDFSRPPSHSG